MDKLAQEPKVVMVISSFYPVIGGAEKQAQLLAQGLIKKGVSVQVITRRYSGLSAEESLGNLHISRLPIWGSGRNTLSSILFPINVFLWLIRNHGSYTIAHVHQSLGHATATLLSKLWTRKLVFIKVTGSGVYGDLSTLRKRPFFFARRWLMHKANAYLILNEETREELMRMGIPATQTAQIINGVDTEKFAPVHQSSDSKRLNVLFVGRLSPEKGVDVLLKAWQYQMQNTRRSSLTEVQLKVLGDGSELSRLKALSQSLDMEETVEFMGAVDNVVDYLQQAQILVLSSHSEGLPNAMLEAMSCGLAVVTTAVGAIPEIIKDGENGLLVPAGDVEALAKAINQVVVNTDLRSQLGNNAHQFVQDNFSINAAVERHLQVYTQHTVS